MWSECRVAAGEDLENIVASAITVPMFSLADKFKAKLKPFANRETFRQFQLKSELVRSISRASLHIGGC